MKRINLELSDELYEKVKKRARIAETYVSSVIREAIEVYEVKKVSHNFKKDPFFSLTRKIQVEGPEDLSENHDKYIYDVDSDK